MHMFVHYTNNHLEVLLTLHFSLVCVCAQAHARIWTKFGESPKFPIAEFFILLQFFIYLIQDRNSTLT